MRKIANFVKSQDQNLKPLTLTLKGEHYLKSISGGIATITARLIVLLYIFVGLADVFNNEARVSTLNLNTNVITVPQFYELNELDFQIGVQIRYNSTNFYKGKPLSNYIRIIFGYVEDELIKSNYYSTFNEAEGRQCTIEDFRN